MNKLSIAFFLVLALSCGFVFVPGLVEAEVEVYNEVHTEAQGSNASVHSEITTVVNGEETKVESDQPGEIKVEVKDGEVKVETDPEINPTVIVSDPEPDPTVFEHQKAEIETQESAALNRLTAMRSKISRFFKNLFSRLKDLTIWPK
jgi:hypothetical protein